MMNKTDLQQRATLRSLLKDVPFLEDQCANVIDALAAIAVARDYAAGSVIFWEGEPATGIYIIESGVVKIARVSTEGREHILHMLNSGDTFNDVAGIEGGLNPAMATAYSDVRVWCICHSELRSLTQQYNEFAWALIESLARRARYLMSMVEDLSMRSVRGRLAHLLLEQARAYESDSMPRVLTQQDMASRLGTVREVVGRALRAMVADGLIEFSRSRIVILDAEALEREAATK